MSLEKRDKETEEDLLFLANNKPTEMGFSPIQENGATQYPRVYRFPDQQRDYVAADLDSVIALSRVAHLLLQSSMQVLMEKAIDAIVSAIYSSSSPLDKREEVKTILVNLFVDGQRREE